MTEGKTIITEKIKLLELDPWLAPHEHDLKLRLERYTFLRKTLLGNNKTFADFANGHLYFGIHRIKEGWIYREWAPGAKALYLTGDFNNWERYSHPLNHIGNGCWEIKIPDGELKDKPLHGTKVKVHVVSAKNGQDRIPLYINRVVQDEQTKDFSGQVWDPPKPFRWSDQKFSIAKQFTPFIYEAHIGMAQESEGVGTYREFADKTLPRIVEAGYNTIQLMGIMEHPYYGSFGYQVSNFFAASSRFGTPEDLRYLINKAHSLDLVVLLDLVHSHAVKNIAEGINEFDGTVYQFFHSGNKGNHPAWDSKLFDYGKPEVIHFLLSNVKYWLEEYHFDGFRFDGVTSMLYHHRGMGTAFDNYQKYFSMDTDIDAVTYLQFANALTREIKPWGLTIAEDMSAMPGMCRPIEECGIGFDYRLAMGIPDLWVKTLKNKKDEEWSMWAIWNELTGRRPGEKSIGYAESHDQALVGDKTIIFWLADKEMYWHMAKGDKNLIVERAMALHKMIRLITLTLGSEGYLNFMGNEFGHPEWIDFPRAGNNWSYKYARRQWSLLDNPKLKYQELSAFDREMLALSQKNNVTQSWDLKQLWIDDNNKIIVYRKGGLIFLFNFNANSSFDTYEFPVPDKGKYKVVFSSDRAEYGGQERISEKALYTTHPHSNPDFGTALKIYTPCRTCLVLEKIA